MNAPSLHEIAEMPFPASMLAMRKHYNADWHKPEHDPSTLKPFKVRVSYSVRVTDSRSYAVEAADEEHARKLAEDLFDDDDTVEDGGVFGSVDVDNVEAEEVCS